MVDKEAVIGTKTRLGLHLVSDLLDMLQHEITVPTNGSTGATFKIKVA